MCDRELEHKNTVSVHRGMICLQTVKLKELPFLSPNSPCRTIQLSYMSFHPHWSKVKSYRILLLFFRLWRNCTDKWIQAKLTDSHTHMKCKNVFGIIVHYSSVNVILKTKINHNIQKHFNNILHLWNDDSADVMNL